MSRYKEIVLVRIMGNGRESIIHEINEMLAEINDSGIDMTLELYSNMSLPTDLSVHLDYHERTRTRSPSVIGQHLAEALKKYGMISHSVWTLEDE